MAKSKPKQPPPKVSKDRPQSDTESHAYNWKQRAGLKRGSC